MNLNENQIIEIEKLSGLFLEPVEIAVLLDIDVEWFLNEISRGKGEIYLAYMKGKCASKRDIHENVIKLAKHGSPQAEELANSMMNKQQLAEKRARK
jgi:hypothetical protein